MKAAKKNKLEEAGWAVGSAADFLELSDAEETIVEMKLALASQLKVLRQENRLTQEQLAKRIGSSQSRVAKMEIADKSVSMELFVRSLVSLGASRGQIGRVMGSRSASVDAAKVKVRKTRRKQPA